MTSSILTAIIVCMAMVATHSAPSAETEQTVEKRQSDRYRPRTSRTRSSDCIVNGYTFRHGEVFTIPGFSHCLKYRCNNRNWRIVRDGCEMNGRCHRVGSVFDVDCVTYRCSREQGHQYSWYQTREIRTRCKDAQGRCRREGETFPYVINGHWYDNCHCTIQASRHIYYSCSHTPGTV